MRKYLSLGVLDRLEVKRVYEGFPAGKIVQMNSDGKSLYEFKTTK